MSEATERPGGPTSNVRNLTDALRKVRIAETDRTDVIVELREAERARLEMLADELKNVFAEVPAEDEQFIFAVAGGNDPRLWIDVTSFVVLGRDRRTYRFLKDTRLGRTVILETSDIDDMADCVTNYVAERIIERERALEGDWLLKRVLKDETKRGLARPAPAVGAGHSREFGWVVAAFLGGVLASILGLFAYVWTTTPPA